ncbi:MAG: PAS domain S-box protein [Methylococcaceae bacterium]
MLGITILHTWKVSTQPMSPITGLLSLFFGTGLILNTCLPISRTVHLTISILGWLGAIAALLLLTLRLLGMYWPVELLGLHITGMVGDAPIGYISPVSAFCLLLINAAFLALLAAEIRGSWREWLAWSFGGLVALIGLTLLLAYILGTPLLLRKLLIHPALNTSLNLFIMGLALLVLAARDTCRKASSNTDTSGASLYILIFAVFTAGIIAVGYDHYRETEIKFRQKVESELLAISKLKTGELVQWRKDLLGDASLTKSAVITTLVRQLLETPHSLTAQQEMQDWLGNFQRHIGALKYGRAVLLDTHGVTLMSVPDTAESLPATLVNRALASLKSGKVTVQDFYRDEHDQLIYLALIVPIFDKLNGNQPLGAIVLRIDPTLYIYPFIQSWPTPSNSAETLLVRMDDNQVLYLNDLRFQSNSALQLSQPLVGNTEITGIGIIMGHRGIQDGLDYRGVPVIAAIADVPGSPWYLVTKMDAADIYAPLRNRLWLTLLLVGLLIGSLATLMFLLWRHQRLVFQKRQLESALKIKKNEEDHQLILNTIMDGFLRLDSEACVLEVNPVYCRMSGYSEKELLNLCVTDLDAESPEITSARIRNVIEKGEARFETRHRRKDGSVYQVEVSAQFRPKEDGQFVVFLHDIGKRKMTETALMKSESQLIFALQKANTGAWELNLEDNTAHRTLLHDQIFGYETLLPSWTYEMFLDHVLPEDRPEVDRLFHQAVTAQEEWSFECRIHRTDGEMRWIYAAGDYVHNSKGEPDHLSGIVQDITKNKLAELALRESEQNYKTLINSGQALVWASDTDKLCRYFNSVWLEFTGRTLEQEWGDGWTQGLHPDDFQHCLDIYFGAFDRRASFRMEYRLRHHDGMYRWILDDGCPRYDTQGEFIGYIGHCLDINERKQTEEALRESEFKFKALAETSPLAICLSSGIEQNAEYINPTFTRLFGYTMDEVPTEEYWWPRAYPDETYRRQIEDEWHYRVQHAIETGSEIEPIELIVTCKDGSHKTIQWGFKTIGKLNWAFGLDISERKQAEKALLESEERFRSLMEDIPSVAVQGYGLDGKVFFWNRASELLYGYTAAEALGANLLNLIIPPEMKDSVLEAVQQMKVSGEPIPSGELLLKHKNGSLVPVLSSHALLTPFGRQPELFCLDIDLTERKEAEERLQLAASVFTHAQEGIVITDVTGSIIEVNDAFCRITGYDRDEVLGQNPRILNSGRHEEEFYATMWHDLQEKKCWSGEIWNRRKNGEVYAELLNISALLNTEGEAQRYIALFTDITALKTYEVQLVRNAHYDALTNLPNRVLLADRMRQGLAQVKRRGNRLAVAFLDLDGFKDINDKYGHDAGDRLLIALANRMKQALREGDTLARIGGDEFVAVLFDLPDIESSVPMLARLLAAAAQPVQQDNFTLQVSASIGLTFYPQTEDLDADQLIRQADQAMYQAKQSGKNRYHFFNADQNRSIRSHHEDLERIRHALATQEFVLYYQPKVNMRTGMVIGAEALIRWQHPERGLLPPLAFLPVIEEDPLSVELGKWVIDTALTEMEHWRAVGLDIPVSVNVSSHQLQQVDFVERLREVLATHPNLRLGELELEVLETSALKDLNRVSQIIEDCRELGVMFALDDFGTGYSSLTYLKRLPVSQIKIDQSFVRDILNDNNDLAIIEGVLALATAFQLQVIAEGVETIKHGELLLQLGCDLGQGYGIAPPMPAADFPDWLATWLPDPTWVDRPSLSHDDLQHNVNRKK